jgi:hypothetical protein
MFTVAGLVKDPHQARGLIRALKDAGFQLENIDMSGGPVPALVAMGLPESEAHVFAEGVRRGGSIVCAKAGDEMEAEQAALLFNHHGAVDIEACDAGWRRQGWKGRISAPEDRVTIERYAYVFGEYPSGAGRIYRDPRTVIPPVSYRGPERRRTHRPYGGVNRRAA